MKSIIFFKNNNYHKLFTCFFSVYQMNENYIRIKAKLFIFNFNLHNFNGENVFYVLRFVVTLPLFASIRI